MKTLKVTLFAAVVFVVAACGSKSNENAGERLDLPESEMTAEEKEAQAKKEAEEKRIAAQEARHKAVEERWAKEGAFYTEEGGEVVYNKAEVAPMFPGGEDALSKYFDANLKYPKEALDKGLEGTIFVEFIVGKDGKVRGSYITEETDPEADQSLKDEAIRAVNSMPRWAPGKQIGKPVNVKYSVPVSFKIT